MVGHSHWRTWGRTVRGRDQRDETSKVIKGAEEGFSQLSKWEVPSGSKTRAIPIIGAGTNWRAEKPCLHPFSTTQYGLDHQESANVFCKEPDCKYVEVCRPLMVCHILFSILLKPFKNIKTTFSLQLIQNMLLAGFGPQPWFSPILFKVWSNGPAWLTSPGNSLKCRISSPLQTVISPCLDHAPNHLFCVPWGCLTG